MRKTQTESKADEILPTNLNPNNHKPKHEKTGFAGYFEYDIVYIDEKGNASRTPRSVTSKKEVK